MNRKLKIFLIFMIVLTLCFIWGQSVLSVNTSSKESKYVLDTVRPVLETFIEEENITSNTVRKPAHFIEFAVLGIELAIYMVCSGKCRGKQVFFCCTIGLYTAVIDETIQLFSDRGSQLQDVWLDFVGTVTAVLITIAISHLIKKHKQRKIRRET